MFSKIAKIKYEGPDSKNPLAFHWYDADRVIGGKTMKEQLRFAIAYWHSFCADGSDPFGGATHLFPWSGIGDPVEQAKAKMDSAFDFFVKIGAPYYCFHDVDLVREAGDVASYEKNLKAVVEYAKQKQQETGVKLLWGTANVFSNARYMNGAATNPDFAAVAYAGTQIKNAIDATIALGGENYVFWGGREGYETLLNTDMALEQDNMARLMRLTVDYARSIGYTGDFYIEPKPKEPTKHQYDFDTATVIGFLRKYNLDKDFKMNIEANHATLAQHTFQHELRVARENGFFGSIDANQGDTLLGWDTDQFPTNTYDAALCMYEVLKAGGFTNGGLNFDSKARRGSFEMEDIFHSYIAGMDTFALGLKIAQKMIDDGRIDQFVADRYASWNTGIGADIISGKATMADLEAYALSKGDVTASLKSGRQELLESILNNIMFNL